MPSHVILQVLHEGLLQLSALLEAGKVAPLQTLAYSFDDIIPAFRQFSRAQHVGKIVSRIPCAPAMPDSGTNLTSRSWVVSGGLGSLGLLIADWLAGQGQAYIVLLGRSGRCGLAYRLITFPSSAPLSLHPVQTGPQCTLHL